MKLDAKALSLSLGIVWGAAVFLVGVGNLLWPDYGVAFLELAASIYPGFRAGSFPGVILGALYGLLDGAVSGLALAWIYNEVTKVAVSRSR